MHAHDEKHPTRLVLAAKATTAAFSKTFEPKISSTPAIPPVNWAAIGQQAPKLIVAASPALPIASAVVICWTDAEWAAMQHVFCNSSVKLSHSSGGNSSWAGWQKYVTGITPVNDWSFWGEYRLVQIGSAQVLLFKSNTHLDFPGQKQLGQLISILIAAVKPRIIHSTGTAGGARPGDHVGTVNVVHSATLYETSQPSSSWPQYSSNWSANFSLIEQAAFSKLLFPVPTTQQDLQSICTQFNEFYGSNYALSDLNPGNVNMADPTPVINNLTSSGTPLLTTDSFVVGASSGNFGGYACVEMDDAVIAQACLAAKVVYGSARNISDPVQAAALPSTTQAHWGQAIYNTYGLYTSYNGAIAAWAALAAEFM